MQAEDSSLIQHVNCNAWLYLQGDAEWRNSLAGKANPSFGGQVTVLSLTMSGYRPLQGLLNQPCPAVSKHTVIRGAGI
jgi:hypothetical protein